MKVTLIYPRFDYKHAGGLGAPLGLQYIAAVLREHGHNVSLIDMTFQSDFEVVRETIKRTDVVGISATTPLSGRAYKVVEFIKNIAPDLICIGGGPHATVFPQECLRRGFDIVVLGEGEYTMVALLEVIEKSGDIGKVDGIAFLKNNEIKFTKPSAFIENLDGLPFPAHNLIDWKSYFKAGANVYLIASRGCPYNCLFCKPMQNKLFGEKIRKRTPSNVVGEIEEIIAELKTTNFMFVDDTFLAFPKLVTQICNEINLRSLKINWCCQARVDHVTEEILRMMKNAGCSKIALGVESGSQKVLDFLRKGIRVEDTIRAFDLCHKVGMETHAYIIIGSPVETEEDLKATVKLIKRIRPDSLQVSRLTPTPGSDLYDLATKQRILTIKDCEAYDYYSAEYPLRLEHLTKEDLDHYTEIINRTITLSVSVAKRDLKRIIKPSYLKEIMVNSFKNPKSIVRRVKTLFKLLKTVLENKRNG